MKANEKPCRNCGSTELFSQEVSARGGYGPDLLPIGGFWSAPKFRIRVCGSCGLVEWFVPAEHLSKVKERFHREA
jgi:predicted nucleic-acid-binding Zn-ribbon protein